MEDEGKSWKGIHISQLKTNLNLPQCPRLINDEEHTVLIKYPITQNCIPECYPSIFRKRDYWDGNHVKLPCSEKNVTKDHINRWNIIRNSLSKNISSSQHLENAILSYNKRYASHWNFSILHSFFEEALDETETTFFFDSLLPKIIELALQLPELITGGIPLLKRGHKHSVSLSQLQISCLLANALLCTFPHRNSNAEDSEYYDYPDINFNRLFQCGYAERKQCTHAKIKCLMNYFRRVTNSTPTGIVTFSRQFVPNRNYPNWSQSTKKLPRLYISSNGTIEDDGFALFQVDFANKLVGGGVLGSGCVQEEIRFVICPELIISRLFTQCLGENEVLIVTGCERFNKYKGYGYDFEWDGDYVDGTPRDDDGRKYCVVIALDALCYQQKPQDQYLPQNVFRDMNKAYVGFSWDSRRKKEELCAIATGNWGCGAFKGDPQLKSFLQLMAAAEVGRNLAYFTFGDCELRNAIADIHQFMSEHEVTVGKLFNLLVEYNAKKLFNSITLFEYVRSQVLRLTSTIEEECDTRGSAAPSDDGIPKLSIMKRSFCSRKKINEWFGRRSRSTESSRRESQRLEIDDSLERDLIAKETQLLTNLYKPIAEPDRGEERRRTNEGNDFDVLNKFKLSLRRSIKRTAPQRPASTDSVGTSPGDEKQTKQVVCTENGDELKTATQESNKESSLGDTPEEENYVYSSESAGRSQINDDGDEKVENSNDKENKMDDYDGRIDNAVDNLSVTASDESQQRKRVRNSPVLGSNKNSTKRWIKIENDNLKKRKISDYFGRVDKQSL